MGKEYSGSAVPLFVGLLSLLIMLSAFEVAAQDASGGPIRWAITEPAELAGLEGMAPSHEEAQRAAIRAAENRGFLNARIADARFEDRRYLVSLEAGTAARVSSIVLTDSSVVEDPLTQVQLRRLEGMTFDVDQVARVFDGVIRDMARSGYPLARLEITGLTLERDDLERVVLTVHVDEGPRPELASFEIKGSDRLSPRLVSRLTQLRPGRSMDSYDPDRISDLLVRSGLVRNVRVEGLVHDERGLHIRLTVDDAPPGYFDLALGYLPDNPAGGFLGSGHLELVNPFGGGRNFQLRLDRLPGQASRLDARASDPFFLGSPLSVSLAFLGVQQDSLFTRHAFSFEPGIRIAPGMMLYASASREAVRPGVAGARVVQGRSRIARTDQTMIGAGVEFRSLDDLLNPSRGLRVDLRAERGASVRQSTRVVNGEHAIETRRVPTQRVLARGDGFVPVRGRQVVRVGADISAVLADDLGRAELLRLGGAQSLRGYDEDRFLVRSAMISTVELRHRVDRVSFLFAFVDVAYLERPLLTELDAISGFWMGYGIGTNFDAGFGLLNLSLAFNPEDGIQSPRIHAGVAFGL
jgi:outer membrane protein insertion porin family